MPAKTLMILRHAKAEADSPQGDHARGLSGRGVSAATAMGDYFAAQGLHPDKVLCSDAERTRQTWQHMGLTAPVEYSRTLYLAAPADMLAILAALPEEIHSLLLIGHNPGLHQLCLTLAKSGEEDLLDDLAMKFPTCALAVIELSTGWRNIAAGRLTQFVTPAEL